MSESDYLKEERNSHSKNEYYQGGVFAVAVASKNHNAITACLIGELLGHVRGKFCKVYPGDLRVYNPGNGLYAYPDVTIICGKEEYLDEEFDTLLNPTVLIEVLSPSTEEYDRGTKFKLYRSIPSLQNYLMISSTEYSAEVYTRMKDNEWNFTMAKGIHNTIHINSIDYDLPLAEVYAQTDGL